MSVLRAFLVPSGGWRLRADLTVHLGVISARRPVSSGPLNSSRRESRSSRTSSDSVQVLSDGEELAM